MVARILILIMFVCSDAWGKERCLTCHPVHHAEIGGCTSCHRGNPSATRKNIAHYRLVKADFAHYTLGGNAAAVVRGELLLEQLACRRCHMTGGKGNRFAVSLDESANGKTPEELAEALRKPSHSMPAFMLPDRAVIDVVNGILFRGRGRSSDSSPPVVVRFSGTPGKRDVFSRKCGSCHRILSPALGGLGEGSVGPNLSGIFSAHYPTRQGSDRWDVQDLKKWIDNPRLLRKSSTMPPVAISAVEWRELLDVMAVPK